MVAEDDPNTRAALAEIIRSDGHAVVEAVDGIHAKSTFDRTRPDLICLDVMMPGLSGYDLCRHIRAVSPTVPILFITAKSEEIDKVVGLELGADDYIVKPFGAKEVLARIRAVARRCVPSYQSESSSPDEPSNDFEMNDLSVSPRQLRVRRDAEPVEITQRELRILFLLSSKPGEVVSRRDLFCYAWGDAHVPNSRTLDQTISQLRKRIERDPKKPEIIQTVYGVGYRFEPLRS